MGIFSSKPSPEKPSWETSGRERRQRGKDEGAASKSVRRDGKIGRDLLAKVLGLGGKAQ